MPKAVVSTIRMHLAWLRSLEMDVLMREILDEYLQTYQNMADKIERFDKRIEELAGGSAYAEKVKKLSSLIGIRTHTALALVVETGDFARLQTQISMQHSWALFQERDPVVTSKTGQV